MLINFLQRYINLEDRVKILNIKTMDNFMSSNNHLEIEAGQCIHWQINYWSNKNCCNN